MVITMIIMIRKQSESCTGLQGFLIFHSFGGGTGKQNMLLIPQEAGQAEKQINLSSIFYSHLFFFNF